jgi:site-specific recombinase XerD
MKKFECKIATKQGKFLSLRIVCTTSITGNLLTADMLLQEQILVWLMNYNSCQTRRTCMHALEQLKTFVFERAKMSLLDIKQKHVITRKECLVCEKLSQSTINQKLSATSSLLKYVVR